MLSEDPRGPTIRRRRGDSAMIGWIMSVLIDRPKFAWRGRRWSHLVSDESYDELHEFAAGMGLARERFQSDHYDLPEALYERAVTLGAIEVSSKELVRRLIEAGLRKR